jgi:hypothetical protein
VRLTPDASLSFPDQLCRVGETFGWRHPARSSSCRRPGPALSAWRHWSLVACEPDEISDEIYFFVTATDAKEDLFRNAMLNIYDSNSWMHDKLPLFSIVSPEATAEQARSAWLSGERAQCLFGRRRAGRGEAGAVHLSFELFLLHGVVSAFVFGAAVEAALGVGLFDAGLFGLLFAELVEIDDVAH